MQFGFDCCARLGHLFFERFVPAEENQGPNNHDFSQKSHNRETEKACPGKINQVNRESLNSKSLRRNVAALK